MKQIDLKEFTKGSGRMLSGHERGLTAREFFKIDELESSGEPIKILAPDNLDAISPSFVQGLFHSSVTLQGGLDAFKSLYEIEASDIIQEDIFDGIRRLLLTRRGSITH